MLHKENGMEKVMVDREVYEKVINTLAQLPYAQVAGLLDEARMSAKLIEENSAEEETDVKEDGD